MLRFKNSYPLLRTQEDAQKFLKSMECYGAFTVLTLAILNEFISRIEVHERN